MRERRISSPFIEFLMILVTMTPALDSFDSFFVNLLTTMHMRNLKAGFSDGGCDRNIYMVYHMILQHGKYKNRAEMTGSSQLFTCISASYPL